MATHELKTIPYWFDNLANKLKTYEIRKDDRSFQSQDRLILREHDVKYGYTGREIRAIVIGVDYPCEEIPLEGGYCVLSLTNIPLVVIAPNCPCARSTTPGFEWDGHELLKRVCRLCNGTLMMRVEDMAV